MVNFLETEDSSSATGLGKAAILSGRLNILPELSELCRNTNKTPNNWILIECPPDTEIFSKRRKIYSICVEGMSWWLDDIFKSVGRLAAVKQFGFGPYHVVGGYQKLMN